MNAAANSTYDYFFSSRLNEQLILEWALKKQVKNTIAAYGLGNYYFDLKRHEDAIVEWEKAVEGGSRYGTLYRNLGIVYWNKFGDGEKARQSYIKAIELSPDVIRIRYEFDQLRKKLNDNPKERLEGLEAIIEQIKIRDDFCVELAALYNFDGQYQNALDLIESRSFHPREGGEGQVLRQYTHACLKLGQKALKNGKADAALEHFGKSMDIPDNLGEKYHPLQAVAHINYWKGMAHKALVNKKGSQGLFS